MAKYELEEKKKKKSFTRISVRHTNYNVTDILLSKL